MSTQMEALGDTIDKLIDWERSECYDIDQTKAAWASYATLTAVQELLSEGAELPSKVVEKYLTEAHELMNGESDMAKVKEEHKLAAWLEEQRESYRDGTLEDWKIKELERLPNFSWESE